MPYLRSIMVAAAMTCSFAFPLSSAMSNTMGFVCDTEGQVSVIADSYKESLEKAKKSFEILFGQTNQYGEHACVFRGLEDIKAFMRPIYMEEVDMDSHDASLMFFRVASPTREFWILVLYQRPKPKEEKVL